MRHSDSTIRVSKVASQSYWQKPPSPKWMYFAASANSLPAEVKLIDHASTLDTGYESADILWDHNALCAVRCARRMSMARKSLLTRAVYWALSTPGNTSSTKVDKRKRWLYAEWSLSKKMSHFHEDVHEQKFQATLILASVGSILASVCYRKCFYILFSRLQSCQRWEG